MSEIHSDAKSQEDDSQEEEELTDVKSDNLEGAEEVFREDETIQGGRKEEPDGNNTPEEPNGRKASLGSDGHQDLDEQDLHWGLEEDLEIQQWSDGSSYKGHMAMDLKRGIGEFRWANGESYVGEFYKDHHHGRGTYSWPDGSKFTGSFYLSRKEGFGTMIFIDGRKYQGLYKADVRFGPGVESYSDVCQDVGIWMGHHLFRLCTLVPGSVTMASFPDFCLHMNENVDNTEYNSSEPTVGMVEDPFDFRYKILLQEDSFTLPEKIYSYSLDTDHLPITRSQHREFDSHFYRENNEQEESSDCMSGSMSRARSMKDIYLHVHKYRNSPEHFDWNICSIMTDDRERFGPRGPRESSAEQLIEMAGLGDSETISTILRHDLAHVDVSDNSGQTALHAATEEKNNFALNSLENKSCAMNEKTSETSSVSGEPRLTSVNNKTGVENEEADAALDSHRNKNLRSTMELLLLRGADPNVSSVPMNALFMAVKSADVSTVQLLLECGARTDVRLKTQHGSLTPLHIAAALPVAEGIRITEILLHVASDPNAGAEDEDYVYDHDRAETHGVIFGFSMKGGLESGLPLYNYFGTTPCVPEEGGRTPLHVACEREDNYKFARDTISLLLAHNTKVNTLWSGHSPLSLAIASGNDLAVKELLANGADPNLPLSRGVGSALCTAVNIAYEKKRTLPARIALVDRLIKAGANILMPIVIESGKRTVLGTATDYAYFKYFQDKRIAHTPYHALLPEERDTYNARRQLLEHLGKLTQEAAIAKEQEWAKEGIVRDASTKGTMKATAGEGSIPPARTFFKYCYQCGRSIGVKLTPCLRCYCVYACSKQCKKRSWDELHRDECQQLTGKLSGKMSPIGRASAKMHSAKGRKTSAAKHLHAEKDSSGRELYGDSIPSTSENYSYN
ncbi:ankyrin repeat and MYND domain-containing protein 1 isoform X2 [Dendropsophus ebraccatus]|uniref:ankyrin repeat and MYND domain-containing protein 1 isoform X2 n=1 Tax=Dendropsophus ebraccatus TaxID=150705 RepID=UPI0038312C54